MTTLYVKKTQAYLKNDDGSATVRLDAVKFNKEL